MCDLLPAKGPPPGRAMEVAKVIRLTEKTSGRDKLCRVVQYGSKFVYWVLEQGGLSEDLISKLKSLESSISTARKCNATTS